ncbi:hypothetical protein D3C72_1448670 [compost metagenome]
MRIFRQQRQIGGAARDGFQKIEQAAQGGQLAGVAVGNGAIGDQGQGGIDEGDEARAACLGQGLQTGRLPRGQQAARAGGRFMETEGGKACFDGFLLVRGGAIVRRLRVDARVGRRRAAALVAEHLVELAGDKHAVRFQLGQQGGGVGQAHHLRHGQAVGVVGGQGMGLRIVKILQPVFEVAQEGVGAEQLFHDGRFQ